MLEKDVVKSVVGYLLGQGYFIQEQFETQLGKVDIFGFKWLNNYEIDSIGVECKPTKNPKAIMKWSLEQISRYQKYFTKVYLAIPEGGHLPTLLNICKASSIGYISTDGQKKVKIELEAPEISPKFNDFAFRSEVFHKAVVWLVFREIFGNDVLHSTRGWISTKGDVGLNLVYDDPITDVSINVEDARKVLLKMDEKHLFDILKEAPANTSLWVGKEKYFGRGFRVGPTILQKSLNLITLKDVAFVLNTVKKGNINIHISISKNIWNKSEILSREEYINRVQKAKEELDHLYNILKNL